MTDGKRGSSGVPEGWQNRKLGEIATLQRGFDLPQQDRIEGIFPIVSSGGITGFHNDFRAKAPGVITGRYGTIGDLFFLERDYWPLNTSLWVKDFHGNHEKYVYYLLDTVDFKKLSDKTGVPGVNRNDVHKLHALLPPLEEQRKIAAILSAWDEAIEQQVQLIELKRERKRGLMQQLLTGWVRFKEFTGLEWGTYRFSDLAIIDGGFAFKSSDFVEGTDLGIPIVRMSNLKDGYIDHAEAVKVPEESVVGIERFSLEDGDFVFGMSGSLSNYAWIKLDDLPCYLNQRVGRIRAKKNSDQRFMAYLYLSEQVQGKVLQMAAGAAQLNVSVTDLKNLEFQCPEKQEQQKIATVLSAADAELETLMARLTALKTQKRGLMQRLLTGKTRVQVAYGRRSG